MICNWLYNVTSVQCFMLKRKIKHNAICSGLLYIVLRKIYFKTEYEKSVTIKCTMNCKTCYMYYIILFLLQINNL